MHYQTLKEDLLAQPKNWLVTGVAGFIGSNLLETLLKLEQNVIGLDNFATGHQRNLDEVQSLVSPAQWKRFTFIEGDIRDLDTCQRAAKGADYILHQAALGSVPRSLNDPITTNQVNIDGFHEHVGGSARCRQYGRFVPMPPAAPPTATIPDCPKVEDTIGKPLVTLRRHEVRQ
jgi:UDP-N-acetylglucosamine 4-epimerase